MAGVRDRVENALDADSGVDTSRWGDRLDDLLFEGETVEETVAVDDSRVVVTSHRVLTFTPELEGANFQAVDRPNVVGVKHGAAADLAHLVRGVKWTVIGVILVGAGLLVDLDGIVGNVDLQTSATEGMGVGGILGLVQQMLALIRQVDELLQAAGALAMLAGVAVLAYHVVTRDPTLVLEVSGDDDLHVPRPDDDTVVDRLERVIAPGPTVPPDAGSEVAEATAGNPDPPDRDRDPLADP
ncbi:hypothetical protein ACKVMT_11970 [Halobacteriales archaeon Cl-PHB]